MTILCGGHSIDESKCIMRVMVFDFQVQVTRPPSARQAPIAGHPGVAMGAFIPRDIQEFLDGYPDIRDDRSQSNNLKFYANELKCHPDRKLISEIHEEYAVRSCLSLRPHVLLGGNMADICFVILYVYFNR